MLLTRCYPGQCLLLFQRLKLACTTSDTLCVSCFDAFLDYRIFQRDRFMNIYVGNLSYSVTESDLKDAFSQFGQESNVSVVTDKFSGQSKGFGFVEKPNKTEADAAIKGLNERDLKGRNIKVNQAKPRVVRPVRRLCFFFFWAVGFLLSG